MNSCTLKSLIIGDFHMGTPPLHCVHSELAALHVNPYSMVVDDLDEKPELVVFQLL